MEYGAHARAVRPLAARNSEDATAAATTVDLTNRPLALETLRDVMPEVPGAIAVSSGGVGAFSSVSLRGADLAQTVWVLGDVPLNGPDSGAFDMSVLPLSQLASLEVYRGGAPVWLSQGSIGGVIRVLPREAEGTGASAQAGTGSFGLYQARANSYVVQRGRRPVSLFTGVQVTHAENNYRYIDDQATGLGSNRGEDDVERSLRNAQVLDASGLVHMRVGMGKGHVDVTALGLERLGGVPGTGGLSSNAVYPRRALTRGLVSLAYTREGRGNLGRRYRLQALANAQGEQRKLSDPYGELNLGGRRALQQELGRVFGRLATSFELSRVLETTLSANYARDAFDDHDARRSRTYGPSQRHTQAIAGELRLFGSVLSMRSELRGSVRGEFTQTGLRTFHVDEVRDESQSRKTQAYRLAGLLEPVRGVSVRAAMGTGSRVPSIPELFGDGERALPNTRLDAERGRYMDAGVVFRRSLRNAGSLMLEAQGFWSDTDRKIVLVSLDSHRTMAMNMGQAKVLGAEFGAEFTYRDVLRFVGAATLMDSQNELARQLPRQPKLRTYGRLQGTLRFQSAIESVTLFASAAHVSTAYYDIANTALRPPQTHLGLGAALGFWQQRAELLLRVADLLDARGQDYQRLPLPGRFVGVSLSVKERNP